MTKKEVKKVIETEKACVKRAGSCDRDCANCDLVMDESVILKAYNIVLEMLEKPCLFEECT